MLFRNDDSSHCPPHRLHCGSFPELVSGKHMMLKTCWITQPKQRQYIVGSSHHQVHYKQTNKRSHLLVTTLVVRLLLNSRLCESRTYVCSVSLWSVLQKGCVVLRQSGKTKIKAVAIFHLWPHCWCCQFACFSVLWDNAVGQGHRRACSSHRKHTAVHLQHALSLGWRADTCELSLVCVRQGAFV